MKALANHECPLCGGANECASALAGTLNVECWCSKTTVSAEALARVPAEQRSKACLCPRCAVGYPPSTGEAADPAPKDTST